MTLRGIGDLQYVRNVSPQSLMRVEKGITTMVANVASEGSPSLVSEVVRGPTVQSHKPLIVAGK